jgi:hypothetical protein
MPFGIPMVWRKPQNHYDDCYFCLCNVSGYNKKIKHPHLSSAIRPIPHGPDDPIPAPPAQLEDIESSSSSESTANDDVDFSPDNEDRTPQLFTQIELNNLVRDLGLTKEKSETLGLRLKEKIC